MNLEVDYKELTDLKKKLDDSTGLLKSTSFFNVYKKIKLHMNINSFQTSYDDAKQVFDVKLDKLLRVDDPNYSKAISENKKLLTKNKYLLKVYQTAATPMSSTELEFKGFISEKGFLYLTVQETDLVRGPRHKTGAMSKFFEGNFDELGHFSAKAKEKEYNSFIHKIPNSFRGACSESNLFSMEALETELDLTGHEFVKKIIGDPFDENSTDRYHFLRNREVIKNVKQVYIKELGKKSA